MQGQLGLNAEESETELRLLPALGGTGKGAKPGEDRCSSIHEYEVDVDGSSTIFGGTTTTSILSTSALDHVGGHHDSNTSQRPGPRKNLSQLSRMTEGSSHDPYMDNDTMSGCSIPTSDATSSTQGIFSTAGALPATPNGSTAPAKSCAGTPANAQQRRPPDRHVSLPTIPQSAAPKPQPLRTASMITPAPGAAATSASSPGHVQQARSLQSPTSSGEEGGGRSPVPRTPPRQLPSRLGLHAGAGGPVRTSIEVPYSCGTLTQEPSLETRPSINPIPATNAKLLGTASSLASLHNTLQTIMLQDTDIMFKVQASMRGISSLAKETTNLEVGRDATGATCINQYVVVKTLGRGSFGKVKLCLNTLDGQLYAIKMMNRLFMIKQLQKPQKGLRRRVPTKTASGMMATNTVSPSVASSTSAAGAAAGPSSQLVATAEHSGPLEARRGLTGEGLVLTAGVSSKMMSTEDGGSPMEGVMREIAVLKKLDHPNVVKLHEVIDPPGAGYMMLVMEYMEKGPVLETKTQGGFNSFPERIARDYFRQACAGLDYLHYNNVVHGDLKPENLLVTAAGQLKIGDFGSARILSDSNASSKVSCTPAFQPPEALTQAGGEDPQAADVWALGVCLYCFIYGRLPFTGATLLDISESIRNNQVQYPAEVPISRELHSLFEQMLCKDMGQRISLQGIMEHPWTTDKGMVPLPSLRSLITPPKMIEVSKNEAQTAINQSSLVNMLRARLKEKTFGPGEVLFNEGDEAHCIYMIMSGVVEITTKLHQAGEGGDASLMDSMDDHSFSVDLDESFTLDGNMLLPTEGMDMQDGRLHINRQKAQALKDRMRNILMGRQQDYVTEVKGPGQVIGDLGLDKAQVARYMHSARARDHVTVVKLTEDSFMKAVMQQQQDADKGPPSTTDELDLMMASKMGYDV